MVTDIRAKGYIGTIIGMGHHQQCDSKNRVIKQLLQIGVDAVLMRPIPKRELVKIFSDDELSIIKMNQVSGRDYKVKIS